MKLYIGGDVVPTIHTADSFIRGDIQTLFGNITNLTQTADAYVVNLECCLTDGGTPIRKKGPNIKAPTACIHGLKKAGITHVALANNHSVDFGEQAAREMLLLLRQHGFEYFGIGDNDTLSRQICYVEKDDVKVAFVNVAEHEYTYAKKNSFGVNPFRYLNTVIDIQTAKQNADYVIVLFHGGKEYCRYPSPRLMETCRLMAVAGANLVACQHSHCVGCYEEYEGCHILYGQGNYNFVKRFDNEHWQTGLLLEVTATKTSFTVNYIPTCTTQTGIDVATGKTKDDILNGIRTRNQSLKDGTWMQGWQSFVDSVKDDYTSKTARSFSPDATEDEKERFPHFLDCEAHLDVLKTLYPSWHGKD